MFQSFKNNMVKVEREKLQRFLSSYDSLEAENQAVKAENSRLKEKLNSSYEDAYKTFVFQKEEALYSAEVEIEQMKKELQSLKEENALLKTENRNKEADVRTYKLLLEDCRKMMLQIENETMMDYTSILDKRI